MKFKRNKKNKSTEYRTLHTLPKDLNELGSGVSVIFVNSEDNAVCNMLRPVLEKVNASYNVYESSIDQVLNHVECDVNESSLVPATIILRDGVLVNKIIGYKTEKELVDMLGKAAIGVLPNLKMMDNSETKLVKFISLCVKGLEALRDKIIPWRVKSVVLKQNSGSGESNLHKAMIKTNPNWRKPLMDKSSHYRKSDNAMALWWYLLLSLSVEWVKHNFFEYETINNPYYPFMVGWAILLTSALLMQLVMKWSKGLSWPAVKTQSSQILILVLVTMMASFITTYIVSVTNPSSGWKLAITGVKSLLLFVVSSQIFRSIENKHKRMIAIMENGLYYRILTENNKKHAETLRLNYNKHHDETIEFIKSTTSLNYVFDGGDLEAISKTELMIFLKQLPDTYDIKAADVHNSIATLKAEKLVLEKLDMMNNFKDIDISEFY